MAPMTVTARWLFPVEGPPLEGGALTIGQGRIVRIAPRGAERADIDFGNAAITPGFVNAHAHLDLTGARGRIPPGPDFIQWLRGVIAFRPTRTAEQTDGDIAAGIAECHRFGTTTVGDISVTGATSRLAAELRLRASVFRELLGLSLERAKQATALAGPWLTQRPEADWVQRGLSPHAPYSFNFRMIDSLSHCTVALGTHTTYPLAIHLAESREEMELLERRAGPFVPFLEELGLWNPDGLPRSAADVVQLTRAAQTVLFAHGNYLPVDTPMSPRASIVYCPRTHAAFGHPPHPFREFLARGRRVALGTDSLASNPDLSLLAEARFIAERYADFDRAALLRMATLSGAEALGCGAETGSLAPGKSADFAIVDLPDHDATDPHELLLGFPGAVQSTWFRGERVFPRS